jgi:hypothetical protein
LKPGSTAATDARPEIGGIAGTLPEQYGWVWVDDVREPNVPVGPEPRTERINLMPLAAEQVRLLSRKRHFFFCFVPDWFRH